MAWRRKIPFGYMMQNGAIVLDPDEASAVARIFERYLTGGSYMAIALTMYESGVRYHAATPEWNKHMVKRILENGKYAGGGGWPQIILPDIFDQAARIRMSKTDGRIEHPACNKAVKHKLVCAGCGAPFRIRNCLIRGIRWWRCDNEGCGVKMKLTDDELARRVTSLLNRLIRQPGLLRMPPLAIPWPPECERIQNELNRQLSKTDWQEGYAKSLAFACAAERYHALGDMDHLRQKAAALQKRLSAMPPLTDFDGELFNEAVDSIHIAADGDFALKLISGKFIREKGS